MPSAHERDGHLQRSDQVQQLLDADVPTSDSSDSLMGLVHCGLVGVDRSEDPLQLLPGLFHVGADDGIKAEQVVELAGSFPEYEAPGCHALEVSIGQSGYRAGPFRMGYAGGEAHGNLALRQPRDQRSLVWEDDFSALSLVQVPETPGSQRRRHGLMPVRIAPAEFQYVYRPSRQRTSSVISPEVRSLGKMSDHRVFEHCV